MPGSPLQIELHLTTGEKIAGEISEYEAIQTKLGLTGSVIIAGDPTPRERATMTIATALAYRMEKGEGFFTLTDPDGRFWIVRAESIVAAVVRDPDDVGGTRQLGFLAPPDGPDAPASGAT
jgi:hypothetical protein